MERETEQMICICIKGNAVADYGNSVVFEKDGNKYKEVETGECFSNKEWREHFRPVGIC